MGNALIKPLNDECPISLEKISKKNKTILNCKHQYNNYYLQLYCKSYLSTNNKNVCPLCRKEITSKEYKKIYTNYKLFKQTFSNYGQLNIVSLTQAYGLNKSLKEFICVNKNKKQKIYLPLYNHKNITQPLLLKLRLDNLKLSTHSALNLLSESYSTEFGEENYKYNICIKGEIRTNMWYFFINNIYEKIQNKKKYNDVSNIYRDLILSPKYIRLLTNDTEEFKTYDIINGTLDNVILLKNYRAEGIFMSYFVEIDNKLILINKLFSLLYY